MALEWYVIPASFTSFVSQLALRHKCRPSTASAKTFRGQEDMV